MGDNAEEVIAHLKTLIKNEKIEFTTFAPEGEEPKVEKGVVKITPNYKIGQIISTRKAYGNGLLRAR